MTGTELSTRLEKLESDNRRLRRFGVASLVLVSLLFVYVASRSRTQVPNGRITAREFDVVDGSGKVRVRMDVQCIPATNCWPVISMIDKDGKVRTSIGAGTLNISGDKGEVELLDDVLQFSNDFNQSVPGVTARLQGDSDYGGALWLYGKGSAYAFINSNPPVVEIQDSKGFMTDLGSADLTVERTGETSKTSAASIVMFGNDKKRHVIWRAP